MLDQKFQETLSDALQTSQDALSLRREGQDTVNAITDKARRTNDREVIKAVMALDWKTFKPGDRIEVGKHDTASTVRISIFIEYTKPQGFARLHRAAHRAQLDQPTLASLCPR